LLWPTNAIAATTARTPPSPQSLRQPTPPLPQPTPTPQSLRQHHHRRNRCADAAITAIAAPTLLLQSLHQHHHRRNHYANTTPAATKVAQTECSTIIVNKRTNLPCFFL
jgi:hypothetical protein